MRSVPLADVKARLSAYVDECGVDGPIVITRNGHGQKSGNRGFPVRGRGGNDGPGEIQR